MTFSSDKLNTVPHDVSNIINLSDDLVRVVGAYIINPPDDLVRVVGAYVSGLKHKSHCSST
jgi:hypothetical protein